MNNDKNIKVGFDIGDLNGIGGELILKALEDTLMVDFCTPVIFANKRLMSFLKKQFGIKIHFHAVHKAEEALEGKINIVNVWKERVEIDFGQPSEEPHAKKSFDAAFSALKEKHIDVLIRAPHGSYEQENDAQVLQEKTVILKLNEELRIANFRSQSLDPEKKLDHKAFTAELQLLTQSLLQSFRVTRPRIAVLTPCWQAEKDPQKATAELTALIQELNDNGLLIYGLYNRTRFFETDNYQHFDAIIDFDIATAEACYKGWTSLPMVNYFAGPIGVMVNSDQGVNYALAGKNTMAPHNFRQAIYRGIDLFKCQEEYKEISANPLKKYVLKSKKDR